VNDTSIRTLLAALPHRVDVSPFWYDLLHCTSKPSLLTYAGFIDSLVSSNDSRLLQEIHKHISYAYSMHSAVSATDNAVVDATSGVKKRIRMDGYTYARIMLAYAHFNRWLAVQHLFQQMSHSNISQTT